MKEQVSKGMAYAHPIDKTVSLTEDHFSLTDIQLKTEI